MTMAAPAPPYPYDHRIIRSNAFNKSIKEDEPT